MDGPEVSDRDIEQYAKAQPYFERWAEANERWHQKAPEVFETFCSAIGHIPVIDAEGCLIGLGLMLIVGLLGLAWTGINLTLYHGVRFLIPGVRRMDRLHNTILRRKSPTLPPYGR